MNKEFLEDYQKKELEEYRSYCNKIDLESFSFKKFPYPPDERFVKIKKPVTIASNESLKGDAIWAQLPFTGSLIFPIFDIPKRRFEEIFFQTKEIPKLIDYVKETGKLQFVLIGDLKRFEKYDYLEPIFTELKPPMLFGISTHDLGNKKDIIEAGMKFETLANVNYSRFVWEESQQKGSFAYKPIMDSCSSTYVKLKMLHFDAIMESLENYMIVDPYKAFFMFDLCSKYIVSPLTTLRHEGINSTTEEIQKLKNLIPDHKLEETIFPVEIGKFLLNKLTRAPKGQYACNELISHYEDYDLRKIVLALNTAIVENQFYDIEQNIETLSEILENVWSDPLIKTRIELQKYAVLIIFAAIGIKIAQLEGGVGGFLTGIGITVTVLNKYIDKEGDKIFEKIAKLRCRGHQVNIFDFQKTYKNIIPQNNTKS